MGAVLISNLHPAAERIDGAGGDDGRDVQLRTPEGTHVWELKYFVDRLQPKQRRQIQKSLMRAAELNPLSWTLVIPLDSSPAELVWFDRLRGTTPFPLRWAGLSWLDGRMAEHPVIPRYFVWGGATEAIEELKQLHQEQAALANGVPDAVDRIRSLTMRLADLDPFWRFEITLGPDGAVGVTPIPKYRDAPRDRPIRVKVRTEFPDSPEGQLASDGLRRALEEGRSAELSGDFITSLEIDAPAGLGGTYERPALRIDPQLDPTFRLPATLVVIGPDGRRLGALAVLFNRRFVGTKFLTAEAVDPSNSFHLSLKASPQGQVAINFAYREHADLLPAGSLPILRFLEQLHAPNLCQVEVLGEPVLRGYPGQGSIVFPSYVKVIAALAEVQTATHTPFPIPDDFSDQELDDLLAAGRLLQGEEVEMNWQELRYAVVVVDSAQWASIITDASPLSFRVVTSDYTLAIAGRELDLGPAMVTFESGEISNREELARLLPLLPGAEFEVTIKPSGSRTARIRLGAGE